MRPLLLSPLLLAALEGPARLDAQSWLVDYEVDRDRYSARSAPARLTTESDSALREAGYILIGYLTVWLDSAKLKKETPTEHLCREAGKVGADLVTLGADNVVSFQERPREGRCLRTERQQQMISVCNPQKVCHPDWVPADVCVQREVLPGDSVRTITSNGGLWRYEPSLRAAPDYVRFKTVLQGGDLSGLRALLAAGANPRVEPPEHGETLAQMARDSSALVTLLDAGAPVSENLLTVFAGRPAPWALRILLARGEPVNPKGYDPLSSAVMAARDTARATLALEAIATLVAAGGSVNRQNDYDGWTPLHWAASSGSLEATRFLIEHGALTGAKTRRDGIQGLKKGATPLGVAIRNNQVAVAEYLLEHGADPREKSEGQPPLKVAQETANYWGQAAILRVVQAALDRH